MHGVSAGKMPAHEFDRQPAAHDDAGGLGIDPDVVLGGRRHVAFTARRAAHDHAASDFRGDLRLFRQRQRNIRERRQRDDDDSGIRLDRFDDGVHRVPACRRLTRSGIVVISEAIAAVKPGRILIGAEQRLVGAGVDRDVRSAEFDRVESVAGRLQDRDISGDGCDRHHANVGRTQRHDERDGVVGSCVGIDQEGARHAG